MAIRLATDIGGTFTDLVAFDEHSGRVELGKAASTPNDLAQGILDSIAVAAVTLAEANYFVHGCTVVINAITERSGAKTALVTTAGFRDVLEIGRGNRSPLRTQEALPGHSFAALRSRLQAALLKDPLYGVPRDFVTEIAEHVANAGVSEPGVLGRNSDHQ